MTKKAVTQEQQARKNLWGRLILDYALGLREGTNQDTDDYFGSGRAQWDSNWTNPAVTHWILYGGTAPWQRGGGTPQAAQTSSQSCKPNGAPCASGDECCSINCNNNTSLCSDSHEPDTLVDILRHTYSLVITLKPQRGTILHVKFQALMLFVTL